MMQLQFCRSRYTVPATERAESKRKSFYYWFTRLAFFVFAIFWACAESTSPVNIIVRVEPLEVSPHPAFGTPFVLIDEDPTVIFGRVQLEQTYSDHQSLVKAFAEAVERCCLSKERLDQSGSLAFQEIPPGNYWVVNPEPVQLGKALVIWAHPVSVTRAGSPLELRLAKSNAALILEEKNFRFR